MLIREPDRGRPERSFEPHGNESKLPPQLHGDRLRSHRVEPRHDTVSWILWQRSGKDLEADAPDVENEERREKGRLPWPSVGNCLQRGRVLLPEERETISVALRMRPEGQGAGPPGPREELVAVRDAPVHEFVVGQGLFARRHGRSWGQFSSRPSRPAGYGSGAPRGMSSMSFPPRNDRSSLAPVPSISTSMKVGSNCHSKTTPPSPIGATRVGTTMDPFSP